MAEVTPSPSPSPSATPAPAATPAPSATPAVAATPSPAPSTTPTPAATATVLSTAGTADPVVSAPADWPADWREKLAGGDDKKLGALKRYASPQAYADAGFQLRSLMDSKQLKQALPADAAPEDVTRWRSENGIPEKPEGYFEKIDKNVITDDADKALITPFLAAMHAKNASPDVVNAALAAWTGIREQVQTERNTNDVAAQQKTEDTLRPEWGQDYRRNINVINGWLDTAPKGVKDAILNSRSPDDIPLASNPEVLRFLLSSAINANPAATVVPGSPGTSGATIEGRIGEIEKVMRENRAEYNRNSGMQQELLKLYGARESLKARSAA